MNIELTEKEKQMLSDFAAKQYDGAKDNIGTMTPIHVVEHIHKEYVDSDVGEVWILDDDYDYKTFDSFDEMIDFIKKDSGETLPEYNDVEFENVETDDGEIFIEDEKAYCKAFGIDAFKCSVVEYTEPVAFFFIRDEAVRYKNEYQAHNCKDCRIYTYGLGYSNNGDLPIFRNLLMRMGEMLNKEKEEGK